MHSALLNCTCTCTCTPLCGSRGGESNEDGSNNQQPTCTAAGDATRHQPLAPGTGDFRRGRPLQTPGGTGAAQDNAKATRVLCHTYAHNPKQK